LGVSHIRLGKLLFVDPVAALIREVADQVVDPASGVLAEVEEAVLGGMGEPFRSDPVMAEEALASTRENAAHWIAVVRTSPYTRVTPLMAPSVVGIARAATRRGAARNIWAAYNSGRNVVWRHWMRLTFAASTDTAVVARSLEVVADSLGSWIDETLRQLTEHIEQERDELTRASAAQHLETVTLVLEGAPIEAARAADRLGYPFEGRQLGAVLWGDPGAPDRAALSRVAEELRRRARAPQILVVAASSFSLWLWLGGFGELCDLADAVADAPDVRCAIGSPGRGVEGFRRSHDEAVEAQRLMMRSGVGHVATFAEVALAALAGRDEQAAREYMARTLGALETADAELRETVRVYIRAMYSTARTAEILFTHRNTVLNRIHRAEALLPEPLAVRGLEIGAALELSRWLGGPKPRSAADQTIR
jgi:DNA-binding PucR family transcriptional regulator